MVGRRSRRIGLVRGVDVSADRLVKDVESVKLVDGAANLREGFLQGVGAVAVVRQDRVEDALEESSAGVRSSNQADRGDGHRLGGVDANLGALEDVHSTAQSIKTHYLGLSLLSALILLLSAFIELAFALLDHLGINWLLELFEDLCACESVNWYMGCVDYLTSSPE